MRMPKTMPKPELLDDLMIGCGLALIYGGPVLAIAIFFYSVFGG